jgi:multidrug efflux pump subunit AcrA (membrane-fusion protein)
VPLSVGQPLFEIAPIERMVAEVEIPQAELAHVAAGQSVSIKLEAFLGQEWLGEITRVQPRSEMRGGGNVFIAEIALDNAEGVLRPGMHGQARITTARRPIGWIVFHGPWRDFVHWSGWY